MIEANFESRTHKNAAIAGVYQYDTGQRLRMRGLPTPDELAEMDDFLAGDVVTVQAQYGYAGTARRKRASRPLTRKRAAGWRISRTCI